MDPTYLLVRGTFCQLISDTKLIRNHSLFVQAAVLGYFSLIQLRINYVKISSQIGNFICSAAVYHDRLDVLQWCRQIGMDWSSLTTLTAAEQANLRMIPYLVENGCNVDQESVVAVIRNNCFDIFEWLHKNATIEISYKIVNAAVMYGRLEILRYVSSIDELHMKILANCSCDNAVGHGHLDVVKFIHELRSINNIINNIDKRGSYLCSIASSVRC